MWLQWAVQLLRLSGEQGVKRFFAGIFGQTAMLFQSLLKFMQVILQFSRIPEHGFADESMVIAIHVKAAGDGGLW